MKYKFIGEDYSLGYRTGEVYDLEINEVKAIDFENAPITIRRKDGTGLCPYSSKKAFEENWVPQRSGGGSK